MAPVATPSARWPLWLAVAYLAAHLLCLPTALEDIDSINFALGLHVFDVAQHQPHPPGYPVYVALGRVSLWLVSHLTTWGPARADTFALAIWSALGGAVAVLGAARLFAAVERRFGEGRDRTLWCVALLASAPLFWMSGLRPMSDMPGLAAVLWSQALLVEGMSSGTAFIVGTLLAGLAGGIRIQTLALTSPLVVLAMVAQRGAGLWWLLSRPGLAGAAGVLTWAVPLMLLTGGLEGYLAALGSQAGEDFAWVNMLWYDPSPRRLAFALDQTLALPWASRTLFTVVAVLAAVGGGLAALRMPAALAVMLLAFAPYLVYHLLLQETATVRYALPVVPLVAWLAGLGAQALGRRPFAAGALVAVALVVAVPGGVAYGREPHPAFRAIADTVARASRERPARVFAHYGLRRSLQHGAAASLPLVEPRRQYEWLGVMEYWRAGGVEPVWFFADPLRTDLALLGVDGRAGATRYAWSVLSRSELGGVRPVGVDVYRLTPPEWFVGEGWSLTPETGGIVRASAAGPDRRPIEAWVRRGPEPRHLVIGGLHLGPPDGPDVEMALALDGQPLTSWRVTRAEEHFLRIVPLPAGIPPGPTAYAVLTVTSRAVGASREGRTELAVRQFDVKPTAGVVFGFGDGWYEPEYAPETGVQWRWTGERSELRLAGTPQPVRLTLTGESPLKYFDAPPVVTVVAGGRTLQRFTPDRDFTLTIDVPADVWQGDAATVTMEIERVYRPGEAEGTADARRLGLRLFDVRIDTGLQ